jgi:hypothetical protein
VSGRRASGRESQAGGPAVRLPRVAEQVVVVCTECKVETEAGSPELRLELTIDDEPLVYCSECWEREFGGV